MILGIDATNIRAGGGLTHLIGLLSGANKATIQFEKIIVWSSKQTLSYLPKRDWLDYRTAYLLKGNLLCRTLWQKWRLPNLAAKECDLLLVPGGSYQGYFQPYVVISQTMLPFDVHECKRYGMSWMRFKLYLLKIIQSRTLKNAAGIICLTHYASKRIMQQLSLQNVSHKTIAHGINTEFHHRPKIQYQADHYSDKRPFRVLYISTIDLYKHQWQVIKAIALLRAKRYPIVLDLIGAHYKPALQLMTHVLKQYDPLNKFTYFHGHIDHKHLPAFYAEADLFVFASSCEALPIILLEAMAASMPIACSDRASMPDILQDGGIYFNPEEPVSIANAIEKLFLNFSLRADCAKIAHLRAAQYSWTRCAEETFSFLADTVKLSAKNNRQMQHDHRC